MKRKNRLLLWVAILCMLVSILGSYFTQTAGGSVEIRKLNLVVSDNDVLYAQMYKIGRASCRERV